MFARRPLCDALVVLLLAVQPGCGDDDQNPGPVPVDAPAEDALSVDTTTNDTATHDTTSAASDTATDSVADSVADSATDSVTATDSALNDAGTSDSAASDTALADASSSDAVTNDTSATGDVAPADTSALLDATSDATPADASDALPADGSGDASADGDASVAKIVLLISELQTRGGTGGSDEFIELYNPNDAPVTFDSTWEVWARNASTACATLSKRVTGSDQIIPAHGHVLFTGSGYDGPTTGNGTTSSAIGDSGQVVLLHGGKLVSSLCFYFNATTQTNLTCATPPSMWFECTGSAVSNTPHNDTTTGASNSDVSMERKPGGAAGNGQETGDNSADFTSNVTSTPQNLASPPVP